MGIQLLIVGILGVGLAQECEDAGALIRRAERNVESYFLAEAESELRSAKAALACGPLIDRETLAKMWLAEGVLLALQENEEDAERSFLAASRTLPGTWNDNYGPEMRKKYDIAVVEQVGEGQIRLRSVPKDSQVGVDGEIVDVPIRTLAGLHLVQVGQLESNAGFARVINLPPNEQLVLTVPVRREGEDFEPLPESAIVMTYKGHPSRNIAIGAGAAGLLAGTALVVAGVTHGAHLCRPAEFEDPATIPPTPARL
ncbi:MAG: hypothetical protein HN348_27525 [Proteobacteria bacterium]|nr:hypothetical protein [Pseudomonadota bacterium]